MVALTAASAALTKSTALWASPLLPWAVLPIAKFLAAGEAAFVRSGPNIPFRPWKKKEDVKSILSNGVEIRV